MNTVELKMIELPINRKTKRYFVKWLYENGWEYYDCMERWINLKQGKTVLLLTTLYSMFKSQNP